MSYDSALASFVDEHLYLLIFGLLAMFSLAWFFPTFGDRFISALERHISSFARTKGYPILTVGLGAIVIRLCFLPILPIPVPEVHDEFSYLLAGDTFAHGRLTNPPHPMALFLDTFHVIQFPTYMSKYPPVSGAFLALGQTLGHPWIGVLLSMGILCGALLWMLQGWFSPPWAFLGAGLAFLQLGIWTYWINTYLTGFPAAIGGALVMGAVPRLAHHRRFRDGIILGLGIGTLANSRPFEGMLLCLPVVVASGVWFKRCGLNCQKQFLMLAVATLGVLALTGAFMVYYNYRVIGHPLTMPYSWYEERYTAAPLFIWQKLRPPLHFANPQFPDYEKRSQVRYYNERWHKLIHLTQVPGIVEFYFMPVLWVPLLVALGWALFEQRIRLLSAQFAFCVLGSFAPIWLRPHYVAPLTATAFALIVQGMRHLRKWNYAGRPVGWGITRMIVCITLATSIPNSINILRKPQSPFAEQQFGIQRARVEQKLKNLPEKQLVIVRYLPGDGHNIHQEAVYNRADVDDAKVVWAREIPNADIQPLLNYFGDRQVWLWEPDLSPPKLSEYAGPRHTVR